MYLTRYIPVWILVLFLVNVSHSMPGKSWMSRINCLRPIYDIEETTCGYDRWARPQYKTFGNHYEIPQYNCLHKTNYQLTDYAKCKVKPQVY